MQICYGQVISFPGAEGFGRFASGGRGGKILFVTNLNDNGEGSLRNAIEQKGARTILFSVSGNIALDSDLVIRNDNITIAGQSAPGTGICIKNYCTLVKANNAIIRFIRFRLGDKAQTENDAFTAMGCENLMIDHCSFSWGIDENASIYDNKNSTVQWCIISEALDSSFHKKGPHGYGGIWGGENASFYFNIFANNSSRNPRFNGSRTKTKPETEFVDFRNNIIYNWGINSSYAGEGGKYNIVNNYYKAGLASINPNRILEPFDSTARWYIENNIVENFIDITKNNWAGGIQGKFANLKIRSYKEFYSPLKTLVSAETTFQLNLKFSGAVCPKRDKTDERIIKEVITGQPAIRNGIINSQKEVGGWENFAMGELLNDLDKDGIPDYWEIAHKLDPENSDDSSGYSDTGYTFIEEYLNEIVSDYVYNED